jgi:hypothetical protein
MRIVAKKSNWKHITFDTPRIMFQDWSKNGIKIVISDKEYIFKEPEALRALFINTNPSHNGPSTCWIEVDAMKSIYTKTKERKNKIKLLNGNIYDKEELLKKMFNDSFYYGELGKHALSSSAIKSLLDSPKSYARSLNYKSDTGAFKIGRLIHLAALEPDKINTLCHIVEVQSAVTKKYKDKVKEIGSDQFVYTRKDYDKAMYTVDALLQNDIWQKYTNNAKFEQPAFDILHGYPFRAKADVLGLDYIADLKTTTDLKSFYYSAKKYSYDVQLYIYCNIFKVDYKDFLFFAIDKNTGDLGIYDVKESFYNSGKDKLEYALKVYKTYFVDQTEELNSYVIKGTLE